MAPHPGPDAAPPGVVSHRRNELKAALGTEDRSLLVLRVEQQLSWREVADVMATDGDPLDAATLRARVWNVRLDTGPLADWASVADRSPFVLDEHGVLVRRSELRADTTSTEAQQQAAPPK